MNRIEHLIRQMDQHKVWEGKRTIQRNQFLVRENQTDTHVYFVESGSLRIFSYDGITEHCIRFGYKGSLFAVLDSFISGKPTSLNVQAIKKTTLRQASRNTYMSFLHSSVEMTRLWNELLYELIFQQMEREQDLLTSSPQERYNRVLARSPHLFQEIPHKYIASYLRMTPETLSRIKSLDLDQ